MCIFIIKGRKNASREVDLILQTLSLSSATTTPVMICAKGTCPSSTLLDVYSGDFVIKDVSRQRHRL